MVGRVAFMVAAVGGKLVRHRAKSVPIVCLVWKKEQRRHVPEQENVVTGMSRGDTKSRLEVRGHNQSSPLSDQ